MTYRILLLSAYDAMSHSMWRSRLLELFPEHRWTQLVLPPRHFNWRIRGNSLQWALQEADTLNQDYDLLIATSMVDLASLRGFIPKLADLPTLLYFHENQFAYPIQARQDKTKHKNVEPQLVPLYSTLCADAIVFNSHYNRSTFLQGAEQLLKKLPDPLPKNLVEKIKNSVVIPVPLEEFSLETETPQQGQVGQIKSPAKILELVWNHRWEYDKGPKLLLRVAKSILEQQLAIRLHVVGQEFNSSPVEFNEIAALLRQHATALHIEQGSFGFIENREDYIELLKCCDVVLSTAEHDFQGLAIQEACSLGCTPLTPDALVYPEYIGSEFLYSADKRLTGNNREDKLCTEIIQRLKIWQAMLAQNHPLPKLSLDEFSQKALRPRYADLLEKLARKIDK